MLEPVLGAMLWKVSEREPCVLRGVVGRRAEDIMPPSPRADGDWGLALTTWWKWNSKGMQDGRGRVCRGLCSSCGHRHVLRQRCEIPEARVY